MGVDFSSTERRAFFACGGVARGWRQVVALDHCLVNGTENNKGDRWYNHLLSRSLVLLLLPSCEPRRADLRLEYLENERYH
eukprot:COSAG02_NODE_859_length_16438_cov_11.496236_11_plen_81_part_00